MYINATSLSIYLSMDTKILPCLAIINSNAMNIDVHVFFQIRVFIFSGYMSKCEIAGSYGNSVFSF